LSSDARQGIVRGAAEEGGENASDGRARLRSRKRRARPSKGMVILDKSRKVCKISSIDHPEGWFKGDDMADTEKITINMNAVELGKIDLLVEQGHYSNRTDFIRSAIRSQLEKHAVEVQQSVARHSYEIGAVSYDREEFEKFKARGEKMKISVVGLFHIPSDIPAQLADEVIESIKVYGIFQASEAVKSALMNSGKLK
jgi:Arc/MetJ-type ribon-helix-helix transcriptional regulator